MRILFVLFFCCSISMLKSNPVSDSLIFQQIALTDSLRKEGQREAALALLLESRTAPSYQNASCTAQTALQHKTGLCYFYLKQREKALNYWRDSVLQDRINCLGRLHAETANSHYAISLAYRGIGDRSAAVDHMKEALLILDQLNEKDTLDLAYKYLQAGSLYRLIGDYGLSRHFLMQALRYYQGQRGRRVAELYNGLGMLEIREKKYARAIDWLDRSLTLYEAAGAEKYAAYRASSLHNKGRAHLYLKDYTNARKDAEAALAINQKLDRPEEICKNYELLGMINRYQKRYRNARDYYERALSIRQQNAKGTYSRVVAYSYENIAGLLGFQQQYDASLGYYQRAIQQLQPDFEAQSIDDLPIVRQSSIAHRLDLIRVLGLKAAAWRDRYQQNKQVRDLNTALQTYRTVDSLIAQSRMQFRQADSKYALIDACIPIYEKAIQTALDLYRLNGQEAFLQEAYAFSAKNKVVVLLEGLQDLKAKMAGLPDSLLEKERQLKKQYQQLESEIYDAESQRKKQQAAQQKNRLFQLQQNYHQLIDQFEREYPNYFQLKYAFPQSADIQGLRDSLPEDAAILEYFVGEERLFIFLLTKDELRSFELEKPKDFSEQCNAFRKLLEAGGQFSTEAYWPIAQALYPLLLEQPLAVLPNAISRLIFVPDHLLLQLSFEVLPFAPIDTTQDFNQQYLLRRYACSYAYSNQLIFNTAQRDRMNNRMKAFGGFGLEYEKQTLEEMKKRFSLSDSLSEKRSMGRLAYSDDEVREIAQIFDGDTWLNRAATKAAFYENAGNYRLLHFAMHALAVEENPLNSTLIFSPTPDSADYLLRAAEIYPLRLHAEMAVLSACHTGSGTLMRGEGVRSLARAFAFAGCPSLVASLWSASDYSTKEITTSFYRYLHDGHPKDRALQLAKLDYLEQAPPSYRLPSLWSHLVLIGDSQAMVFQDRGSGWKHWKWMLLLAFVLLIGMGWWSRKL
ncbi:MAG: CHAT domain-containing tetratricopeptide repeat protein [Bacteroidota bacterium]